MKSGKVPGSLFGGCLIAGVGLGLLFSVLTDWGIGMAAGVLIIGIGVGIVLEQLRTSKWHGNIFK